MAACRHARALWSKAARAPSPTLRTDTADQFALRWPRCTQRSFRVRRLDVDVDPGWLPLAVRHDVFELVEYAARRGIEIAVEHQRAVVGHFRLLAGNRALGGDDIDIDVFFAEHLEDVLEALRRELIPEGF